MTRAEPQLNRRPQRAARPGNLRDTETIADGESSDQGGSRAPARGRSNRRRIEIDSDSDAELSNSEEVGRP